MGLIAGYHCGDFKDCELFKSFFLCNLEPVMTTLNFCFNRLCQKLASGYVDKYYYVDL